jgi:thiamine biosynthesis lipoprotein
MKNVPAISVSSPMSPMYTYRTRLLGTHISLTLTVPGHAIAQRAFELIRHLESLLTVNGDRSLLLEINAAAGRHAVQVPQDIFLMLEKAHVASLIPGSCFNLAIGPLVKCWRIGFQGQQVPAEETIQTALNLSRPQNVQLDKASHSVFLSQRGMQLDAGAIAKGFIADNVSALLAAEGIQHSIVNLGGNLVVSGMRHPATCTPWTLGVQVPFALPDEVLGEFEITDQSVVTSGIYERYFTHQGRLYHHLLDPATGYPLRSTLASVTVIAPSSMDADLFSTLLFGMGIEDGLTFLQRYPTIKAIFVTRDRHVVCSAAPETLGLKLLKPDYTLA